MTVLKIDIGDVMARPKSPVADGETEKRVRKASKEIRREQLINATIESLSKRGYADTTMADIADGAGLSRGIVNFHFESKDKLLIATLQHMADEYTEHWSREYERAGPRAANKLWAMVAADFDRRISTKQKLAAWCAFWGEAKSRPTYKALCGARDNRYQQTIQQLLDELKEEGGHDCDPASLALAFCAMLEGLWIRLMMVDGLTRQEAHRAAIDYLVSVFPGHFTRDGPRSET